MSTTPKKHSFFSKMFFLICLLLILIDLPLTLYIDNDYSEQLKQQDINNTEVRARWECRWHLKTSRFC
jgi:hypothetical protein